ncbi:MAG: pilus assembly protein PilM [Myxococcales bacterium]|nr:pilus assembly protein PilM [Myxococcales bacterium]
MGRIVGLDLGGHSVKAVLLETSLRGYSTRAFAAAGRAEGDRAASLRAAVGGVLSQSSMRADQVVVALPGPSLATHVFTLPFTDPKRIEAALPFEVEAQLPFDLQEVVFDYQPLSQREKKSDLMVGVVRREELSALLSLLQELKIDPRVITHPGLAYQNLLAVMESFGNAEPVAVLDIGHERTTVAIGRLGAGVELARTFSGGGRDLSRALAAEFQLPLPEADGWKEANGAVGPDAVGADAERAAGALVRGLHVLLRELRPTLKSYSARSRSQVSKVLLCGGTARLPGIEQQLERDLQVPVERLKLPAEEGSGIKPEEEPLAAQAFALALRGQASGAKAPRFNFRRGDFAFKGDYDYLKDKVGLLASFGAVLLILLVASGVVRNSVLARRERQVDALLCEVTQRVLGQCEKNYDRALNMLKGKESPAAVLPKLSAVGLLSELTARLPTDAPVTIDQVVIDLERVTVRFETDSPKQIDKITTALKTYKCFKEVQEGKVEKTRDGQKVTFRLDIQVECPDAPPQG